MDPRTQSMLQELVRKEGRSLLQYIGESFPWTTDKNHSALATLSQMVKEEQDGAAAVVRLLTKRRVRPPYLGAYPMVYTNINYTSLDHLSPLLVDFEKQRLAELEAELPLIADPEARTLIQSLMDMKRRHLQTLSTMEKEVSGEAMDLFDTHAHLDDRRFEADLPDVLERARQAGLVQVVTVATTAASTLASVKLAESHALLRATAGIQPNHVAEEPPDAWDQVLALASRPEVVGLGETGLDRYWNHTPFAMQEDFFARHLDLSRKLNRPVVIHCREAEADVVRMLRADFDNHGAVSGVMHSFTGDKATMLACLEMGLYISFAGMVTYKNAQELRDVAALTPLDRLVIETDSPYLAPVPMRGKRNEPAFVRHTAQCLAEVHGMTVEAIAEHTTRNARCLFRIE